LRIFRLLNGLASQEDIDLTVFSSDVENPVPDARHIKLEKEASANPFIVLKEVRSHKYDVVVGHTLGSLRYLLLIKLFTRSKIFLEVHGFIAEEAYYAKKISWPRYLLNSLAHRLLFMICDLVTTTSPEGTKIVYKYNRNARTLFCGADTHLFKPGVEAGYSFKKNNNTMHIEKADSLVDLANDDSADKVDSLAETSEILI
jgi:hypothetical protein